MVPQGGPTVKTTGLSFCVKCGFVARLTRCAGLPALFYTCQIPDVPSLAKIGVFSLPCSVSLSPKCIVGRVSMRIEKAALKRSQQRTIAAHLADANHDLGRHGLEGQSMEEIVRAGGKEKKKN